MAVPQAQTTDRYEYQALPKNLLAAIPEFQMIAGSNENGWLNGIQYQPFECRGMLIQSFSDVCLPFADPDVTTKNYACATAITQTAFRVFDPMSANASEWMADDVSTLLDERLPLMKSAYFASELISGAAGSTLALSKSATAPGDLAFNTAVSIQRALAVLETELAVRLHGVQGTIHLPPGLVAPAVQLYGLKDEGTHWVTPVGNKVIVDAGYVNAVQPTGQSAPTATTEWIYASGPITHRKTDVMMKDEGGTFDLPTNTIAKWLEMYGILKFDPCPVTAALVTYV